MSRKVVILIVVVVLVIGGIVYFSFLRTPSVSEPTPLMKGGEGGAGGSGLPEYPPASKYCKDRQPPKEVIYGEPLMISSDKKKIIMNDKVVLSVENLPTTIQVSPDSLFNVDNQEFTSAVFSPAKSIVAFTVSAGTHGWGGFVNIYSGLVYPVAFQFEGEVLNPKWNHNGHYVVFSKITPKPEDVLTLIDANSVKTYTSEYENVLSFYGLQSLPPEDLPNLRDSYWGEDKDDKLYFLVAILYTLDDIEHAELWNVKADTLKWSFYCSAY